jgi:regulator of protease activity HflC (stomatin/prohibitin superfamily)
MSKDDDFENLTGLEQNQPKAPRVPLAARIMASLILMTVLGVIALVVVWVFFVTTVPAGMIGVQDTFGSVSQETFQPGIHLKWPWTAVRIMSVQTQKYIDYGSSDKATITALSNDGLTTTMGIAVNYRLNPEKAVDIYKNVGLNYPDVIMVNPIHSVPRDLISKYDTKTLYSASREGTTDRAKLEQELFEGITGRINQIGVPGSVVIEQVSIRDIDFPQAYKDTITAKMNMDTEIATKRSELDKERIEAERKVVIAKADADANIARANGDAESTRIRNSQQPSDAILNLAWIQSMQTNPRTIYVPVNEKGLPLFKNVDEGQTAEG